jgi:predicted amidohydrolase YtcJ
MKYFAVATLLIGITFSSCKQKTKTDLIIHNGVLYTVDSLFSVKQAMAIEEGRIVSTGSDKDILDSYSATETVDAKGSTLLPGFIDAHVHFFWYGESLFTVDLTGCKSFEEVVARVLAFSKQHPGEKWIKGRGWDQNEFQDKSFPTNSKLNELFPKTAVALYRVDGHTVLANQQALDFANIKPNQKISGGEIITEKGKLTGILIDNGMKLFNASLPKPSKEEVAKWLTGAQIKCFELGITTVTDCGLDYEEVDLLDSLQRAGEVDMPMYVMLSDKKKNYDRFISKGPYKTDKLFVKGFKVFADGALGSRGACLLSPYEDKPGYSGFLLNTYDHFDSVASVLSKTDFQMCTHAIGDSANRIVAKIYNKHLKSKNDKRWRIEHAQIINENDFDLFGAASIVPSVQPTAAISDMDWADERLGLDRLKGGYAYQQLLRQNGWIALGTDFPIDDMNPVKTFYSAIARRDSKGMPTEGFQIENALTREQALRGTTIWAAKAGFMENEIGSLEVGKKANFIILDKDLMKAKEVDILKTTIEATYLDGKKVFSRAVRK